jgi:hypothetical protein
MNKQRTKEETIIFQNQSHLVQKWFQDCGICPSLFDLALTTDVMVDFCMYGPTKEVKERFTKLSNYLESRKNEKNGL